MRTGPDYGLGGGIGPLTVDKNVASAGTTQATAALLQDFLGHRDPKRSTR
jgi:hypothetical protein